MSIEITVQVTNNGTPVNAPVSVRDRRP